MAQTQDPQATDWTPPVPDAAPGPGWTPPSVVPGAGVVPNTPAPPATTAAPGFDQQATDWQAAPGTQDRLLPNAPYGAQDMMANTMSFGLMEPLRAAKEAGIDYLFGRTDPLTFQPRGFDYMRRAEEIQRGREQFEAQYPIGSTAASLAGGLAYGPARAAGGALAETAAAIPSLWRRALVGAGIGGGGAAVTAAANNPDAPVSSALAAAPIGAGLGAMSPVAGDVGSSLVQGARNLMQPAIQAGTNATSRLMSIIQKDIDMGYPSLADAQQRIMQSDSPLTLTDIYPSLRREVGRLYDSNTAAAPMIEGTVLQREHEARQRLLTGLDNLSMTGPENFQQVDQLKATQRAAAGPAYNAFYNAPAPNPDLFEPDGSLGKILATPAGQQATKNAVTIARNEMVDPMTLGISFDADGNPIFTKVPSWQTLDYIKQGFDDQLAPTPNKYPRNILTGKQEFDNAGRVINGLRANFRNIIDAENPLYPAARATYSGPAGSMDALDAGAHSLSDGLSAAEHQAQFSNLDPGDQDFYRLGQANALRLKIRSTPYFADETKRIANNPEMGEKLRTLFPNPADFDRYVGQGPLSGTPGQVGDENTIFNTNQRLIGGSQTAQRAGSMTAAPGAGMSMVPTAMTSAGIGGGGLLKIGGAGLLAAAGPKINEWIGQKLGRMAGESPQAQSTLARLALAPGVAAQNVIGLLSMPTSRVAAPTYFPGSTLASQWKQIPIGVQGLIDQMNAPPSQ